MTLDTEAEAMIARALEACAQRRALADAAIDRGGEAAADALEDDPEETFVRLPHKGMPYRGALLAPGDAEDWEDSEG